MSFDNSKYDLELAGVGLRVENYRKSEADTFIPRLSSGSQTESEFDLLRSRSIVDFSGGMLQRAWQDDHAFFGSENLIPIFDDGVLYPVSSLSSFTNISSNKFAVTARCETKDYLWLALNYLNGPNFNSVYRIDTSGTVTAMTLPSAIATSSYAITSLVVWNGQVWGTNGTGSNMFYMATTGTSFTNITGGSATVQLLCVFNGSLYATGGGSNDINNAVYRYTGDTTTRSYTLVGTTGLNLDDARGSLFVFNSRLMLTRTDGMWAYDGIRLSLIDDSSMNVHVYNYRYPTALKGYLYFWMHDGMYRYNGSLVEKIYDISEVGFPRDVCAGKNRLWIVYSNSAYGGSSRYDKSMGYDYSTGSSINGRVVVFNGKAMYTYSRTSNDGKPGTEDLAMQGENDKIVWFNDRIYVFTLYSKTTAGLYFSSSTNELAASGTSSWRILTSIFDADFPMIYKALENIELIFDGDVSSDDTIAVEYRTTGFSGNTGWTSLMTLKSQTRSIDYVYSLFPAGLKFKQIQFRFTATSALGYGVKKIVFRYLLAPDMRWQWTFVANCYGDNPLEPLMLKDGTQSTQLVSLLRGIIYDSRITATPIGFTDIDQFDLNGAINNSVTTITLNSTSMLKPFGFVKIDDEIIKYTSKTTTQLLGCTRGSLGSSAAAHSDNVAVFAYYRVIVRKLQQEQIIMDDSDLDRSEDKSKSSQIAIVLQEI